MGIDPIGRGSSPRRGTRPARWVGIDVGGRRKGFHVAVVDQDLHVELHHHRSAPELAAVATALHPAVVAIDAPSAWAPDGERSRPCERRFAAAGVCGIRFTPDARTAQQRTDRYLEWIEHGLELWGALRATTRCVECFPTASWTAWVGPRGSRSRSAWTRAGIAALASHGVTGLGEATDQDLRDAVAAALTARQVDVAPTTVDRYGDLVVPHRSG